MKRFSSLILIIFLCGILMTTVFIAMNSSVSAAAEKWVVAMQGICTDGMVRDAKEEMSVGHSTFDQFCKKVRLSRAVDARCRNNNLEVKCQ